MKLSGRSMRLGELRKLGMDLDNLARSKIVKLHFKVYVSLVCSSTMVVVIRPRIDKYDSKLSFRQNRSEL